MIGDFVPVFCFLFLFFVSISAHGLLLSIYHSIFQEVESVAGSNLTSLSSVKLYFVTGHIPLWQPHFVNEQAAFFEHYSLPSYCQACSLTQKIY